MNTLNLLIVEDDPNTLMLYQDAIDSFNKHIKNEQSLNIQSKCIMKLAEAADALQRSYYDAAIIDLRLSAETKDLDGLEIVESILNNLRIPVYVVSASIGQIDDMEETVLFKKRSREGDFKVILSEILAIYQTGITRILGRSGDIDSFLNKIFWGHLSDCLGHWVDDNHRTPDEKRRSLLRYIAMHMQEYLELDDNSEIDKYHPSEIYIMPVIKSTIMTGDIVRHLRTNRFSIVLTPACTLAHKAKYIQIVAIDDLPADKIENYKRDGSKNQRNELEKIIANNSSQQKYFLPRHNIFPGGIIDFHNVQSIPCNEFDLTHERIASLNVHFVKDIVARFSYYYSRQGSPDFVVDEVFDTLLV